jgi:membrane-associated phospholipid phosphatase
MHDVIQQAVQALAYQNTLTRDGAIICASVVVYLLGLAWLVVVAWQRTTLTVAAAARIVALGVLAYLVSKVLTHVIIDPRPFIEVHTRPLIPTSRDNGFPSDHALLVDALAVSLWWIDRRWLGAFALGAVLVALGRLGVGAHHTLDVVGSLAIVAGAALVVGLLPLPAEWQRPILTQQRPADARAGRSQEPARSPDARGQD